MGEGGYKGRNKRSDVMDGDRNRGVDGERSEEGLMRMMERKEKVEGGKGREREEKGNLTVSMCG